MALSLLEILAEDIEYTPEKAEELIKKFEENYTEYKQLGLRLFNMISGFSIGDMFEQDAQSTITKLEKSADNLYDKAHGASNKAEELKSILDDQYDKHRDSTIKRLFDKAEAIENKLYHLYLYADDLKDVAESLLSMYEKVNDSERAKNFEKYFNEK